MAPAWPRAQYSVTLTGRAATLAAMGEDQSEGCHGFANRETWQVQRWLTAEDDICQAARNQLEGHCDDRRAALALAEWFDDLWHQQLIYTELGRVMIHDIGSVWRVDWEQVAEALAD